MVLWYVRLRRAAKKKLIHEDLLKAECMASSDLAAAFVNPRRAIAAVRAAQLTSKEIEQIQESRAVESDESDLTEDSEEEDLETLLRRETTKYRSAQAKREFFTGMRF